MPGDPYTDPATGVLRHKLGLATKENFLRSLARDEFLDRLTYYLGEVNAIHPFREGNGRAQRAFFEQLASDAGYILNWQHLDADRNIAASAAIMHGDPIPMRQMLDELTEKR